MNRLILFVAQGFGSGRIRPGPGTWGSLVGILWLLVLLVPGSLPIYAIGTLLGILSSVWFCGQAERILGEHDPSSVVIDEITALPLAWLGIVVLRGIPEGRLLSPQDPGFWRLWPELLMAFIAFRIFDIWKPTPIRQTQNLPGGWGVTMDDVVAAVAAAVPVGGLLWLRTVL